MRKINSHQKNLYEEYEYQGSKRYFDRYEPYLAKYKSRKDLRILDIGGASGYFALLLKEYFQENGVEVYVLDITEYDTWRADMLGSEIHFICDSVENVGNLFSDNTFDIVFANRVFHHFVEESWRGTLRGMETYMNAIRGLLRGGGMLCIMDHFYNGMLWDSASSRLIYLFTSIRNPALAGFIKKLGAATAGVGVCFQSEKMWLNRIEKCGFVIAEIDRTEPYKLSAVKRLGLLSRNVSRNNIICAVPNKTV